MNRMVKTQAGGREIWLNYSVEVMFDAIEAYGDVTTLLETAAKETRDGMKALRWLVMHMARDAELARREMGETPQEMPKDDILPPYIHPLEYRALQADILRAVALGYNREIEADDETDVGLAELHAKKTAAGD